MKKLAIIFGLTLILGLSSPPAYPMSLQFDFNGDEVWDTEYTFSTIGETVNMDVWLTDYSVEMKDIYVVGFYIRNGPYTYDYEDLEIIDAWTYDESHGGPWKDCSYASYDGDGLYAAISDCGSYPFDGVDPGADEKVKLHTVVLKATGGNGWIRTYDSEVYDVDVFSSYPDNAYATINGPCVVSIIPETSDIKSGETIQFEGTQDGICNPPSYSWQVTPDCGSIIDGNGLYTAGDVMSDCSDTVTVTDTANEDIQDTASVNISPWLIIKPDEKTVGSGGNKVFKGMLVTEPAPDFCCTAPIYCWSVISGIGSTISPGGMVNARGFYRAGREFSTDPCGSPHEDTIKLTGYCLDPPCTEEVEAKVIIPPWKVTISPGSETVGTGETIQFTAEGDCCEKDHCYTWSLSSRGSTSNGSIDSDTGLYTAGPNSGTDIVKVTDTCNYDAAHTATVTIGAPTSTTTTGPSTTTTSGQSTTTTSGQSTTTTSGQSTTTTSGLSTTTTSGPSTTTTTTGKTIEITPTEVKRSRWIPLFWLMHIKGTETNFAILKTPVAYDSKSVLKLPALVLSPTDIYQVILIMPSILTGSGFDGSSETVTVTVDGASDTFEIILLPAPLDKEKNLLQGIKTND